MTAIGYINVSLEIWGSIFSSVIALCLLMSHNTQSRRDRLFLLLLLVSTVILASDAAAWLFKGQPGSVSYWGTRISNFLVFACSYFLLVVFTHYITEYIGERIPVSKLPLHLVHLMFAVGLVLLILSQRYHFFYRIDENNVYYRQNWFWLTQAGGILGMLVNAGILIHYRRYLTRLDMIGLWTYIALPVSAMVLQLFFYGIAFLNLSTLISILIIFLLLQVEQGRRLKEKELELSESRIAVMLSQIQPHFLYNVLTAIKQLCDIDPQQAKEAIVEFSVYLRGNLDSLTSSRCIPFEREMDHVRNYLSLEKKRFGAALQIRFDIQAGGFLIPPLTVQPIVENAVRHGVTKREGGGTVAISAREAREDFIITVSDDGVGINPNYQQDGNAHVGFENVIKRLESMRSGRIDVESEPGIGTTVTITIPKGDDGNAADRG